MFSEWKEQLNQGVGRNRIACGYEMYIIQYFIAKGSTDRYFVGAKRVQTQKISGCHLGFKYRDQIRGIYFQM